jgi:hypothetical protein
MTRRAAELVLVVLAAWVGVATAGSKEIRIRLHLDPELPLTGTETLYVGPVIIEPRSDDPASSLDMAAAREFDDHLRRMLRRQTRHDVVPSDDSLRPPSDDPLELMEMPEFWQELAEATGADIVVAASIDVKVLDRAGYTTEEYVSPSDGKTYFRQVLVEETGFNFDVLLMVFEGETGELLHQEQVTDFKERNERKLDAYTDLFNDLYNLENRLLGVFVPRTVVAKRTLHTD